MKGIVQVQVRCAVCDRRLADLVNEVEAAQVTLELKCPRIGRTEMSKRRRIGR